MTNGQEDFFIGDRVVLKKNKKGDYNNGDFGTIRNIKDGIATIKLDNNKTKEIKIEEGLKIGLAYATSIHKSQGMTVNDTLIYGEDSRVNNSELFNVASTRMRNDVYLYTTKAEFDKVVQSFKRTNDKVSLIELADKQKQLSKIITQQPKKLTEDENRMENARELEKKINKATSIKYPKPTPNREKSTGRGI